MSLFYSYIAGSLHVSGPHAHLQESSYSCSHNHWFSFCATLFMCSHRAREQSGTDIEPMVVWTAVRTLLKMGLWARNIYRSSNIQIKNDSSLYRSVFFPQLGRAWCVTRLLSWIYDLLLTWPAKSVVFTHLMCSFAKCSSLFLGWKNDSSLYRSVFFPQLGRARCVTRLLLWIYDHLLTWPAKSVVFTYLMCPFAKCSSLFLGWKNDSSLYHSVFFPQLGRARCVTQLLSWISQGLIFNLPPVLAYNFLHNTHSIDKQHSKHIVGRVAQSV